jgi:hypothetical protein
LYRFVTLVVVIVTVVHIEILTDIDDNIRVLE